MASKLCERTCIPCQGGIPPMDAARSEELLGELNSDWEVVDNHHMRRTFL